MLGFGTQPNLRISNMLGFGTQPNLRISNMLGFVSQPNLRISNMLGFVSQLKNVGFRASTQPTWTKNAIALHG